MSESDTLEYGHVIKIISTNSSYDGKYFFVERLYDDELVLLTDTGIVKLGITDHELNDNSIMEIIIVYKPKDYGYILQNKLKNGQWLEIELIDDTIKGQILSVNDFMIELKVNDTLLYIPLDRGLPKQIKTIKKIYPVEEKKKVIEIVDDGILNVIEEEVEEEIQFFYSIEQQKNDFLENLLLYVSVKERTPTKMKQLYKMVNRYIELREKCTIFSDGIYIKRLPNDQILDATLNMKNKLLIPITNSIKINYFPTEESETTEIPENYYHETDNTWLDTIKDSNFKLTTPFEDKIKLFEVFDTNKIINNKIGPNQKKYMPTNYELAYIIGNNEYPLMINKPFIVDSVMSHPYFYIEYSKIKKNRSSIMNKCDLSRHPYYPSLYTNVNIEVNSKFINPFCGFKDVKIVYENKEATFESYLTRISTSLRDFIECYTDIENPFVNMMDIYNELELLDINEINSPSAVLLSSFLTNNVNHIKRNESNTRNSYLVKPQIYPIYESHMNKYIIESYEKKLEKFYSSSEIIQFVDIDVGRFYSFLYSLNHQDLTPDITEREITEIIKEIKSGKHKPLEEQIHKIYDSEQEKEEDKYKPIIMQDILMKDTEIDYVSAIEMLHRQLFTENKYSLGYETFKEKIQIVIDKGLVNENIFPKDIFKIIKEYIIKYKIMPGHIAYVLPTNKKYVWTGVIWMDIDKDTCIISEKIISLKGDYVEEKENMYRKKIMEMIRGVERDRLLLIELRKFYNEENLSDMKDKLKVTQNRLLLNDLKYNNEKLFFQQEIFKKDITPIIDSPHDGIRDKILRVYNLDTKYKAIQIFIEKYTKKTKDKYWLYCIDTNVKLLPTFFQKLASSYLIKKKYDETLEEICLEQGTLSDNGDTWVDKYSGYIIKSLEFDLEEGYNDAGYKNVSRGVIETLKIDSVMNETDEKNKIRNSIIVLIKYAGLASLDDADIDEIYKYVNMSFNRATKKIGKDKYNLDSFYVLSIIGHVLIYVQTLPKGSIKFISSFPNCKSSFSGYPLYSKGQNGLSYLCCIIDKMSKIDRPYSSIKHIKREELEIKVKQFMNEDILIYPEIIEKLKTTQILEEEAIEDANVHAPYSSWKLFMPRLVTTKPVLFQDIGQSNIDKINHYSFNILYHINNYVKSQSPILINHSQEPFLMNTCCDEINDVYMYFTKKIPAIVTDLNEIRKLLKEEKRINKRRRHPVTYSYINTKKPVLPLTPILNETTLFTGLIELFNFDNKMPIPEILSSFNIKKPEFYDRNDSLELKIQKLKAHGYEMNEEKLYLILKQNAKINKIKIKIHKKDDEIDDPLVEILKADGKVMNEIYKLIEEKRNFCMKQKSNQEYTKCLTMEKNFKDDKVNKVVGNLEHFVYIGQIIYNKIQSLLNFEQMVFTNRLLKTDTCVHWKLSDAHYKDLSNYIDSYYRNIKQYFKNKELSDVLQTIPLEKYKRMLQIKVKDPETQLLIYVYIFISIYHMYLSSKSQIVIEYLDVITALFNKENKKAMNFDSNSIKYEVKLSKKNETLLTTEYYRNLVNDELRSEKMMQELKLGKWSVGLQKSMFSYDKSKYSEDAQKASEIMNLMGTEDIDEENEVNEVNEVNEDEDTAFIEDEDADNDADLDGDEQY